MLFYFIFDLVLKKMKNLISDIPITSQTLNINNLRATSTKSTGLNIIRKLIEYPLRG